jgi:hypothetical protein
VKADIKASRVTGKKGVISNDRLMRDIRNSRAKDDITKQVHRNLTNTRGKS